MLSGQADTDAYYGRLVRPQCGLQWAPFSYYHRLWQIARSTGDGILPYRALSNYRSGPPEKEGATQKGRPLTNVLIALAAGHELSYHLTKGRRSIHMLCSGYAKVNPTGVESIYHLRSRRRSSLRHPL